MDHLALLAMDRAPDPDAPFQRPANVLAKLGMAPHQLLEDGHGTQAGRRPQHGNDLGV